MIPTPEQIAGMSDAELDQLRRQVMNAHDHRAQAERSRANRAAERARAAVVVRDEIRAYVFADGDPDELHRQLDEVIEEVKRERGNSAGAPGQSKGEGGGAGG